MFTAFSFFCGDAKAQSNCMTFMVPATVTTPGGTNSELVPRIYCDSASVIGYSNQWTSFSWERSLHWHEYAAAATAFAKNYVPPGENQVPKDCGMGNPIFPATGNKIEEEVDFVSGGEMGLSLVRTYNHFLKADGLFGTRWISNYDYRLTFGPTLDALSCYPIHGGQTCGIGTNTIIYAWRPDSRRVKYVRNATDGVFYEEGVAAFSKIVKQANGSFVLYGGQGETETYSSAGYIGQVLDAHGVGWTMTYTNTTYPYRVTHTSGRYIEFSWTTIGAYKRLTAVRDPAGNYHGYAYTWIQRTYVMPTGTQGTWGYTMLSAASKPGAPATSLTYHYENVDPSALTGKSINGARYSTFAYMSGSTPPYGTPVLNDGRAVSTEHNGADKYTFSYVNWPQPDGTSGMLVTQTNPLGKKTEHRYDSKGNFVSSTGLASTYCPTTTYALTEYNTDGLPSMKSDYNNNKTAYSYNAKKQLTQTIEAYGTAQARTTQYTWDTNLNRLLSVTILGVSQTTYTYAPDNRLATQIITNLSANGVVNQSRTVTYAYTKHPNGMLSSTTVDGPLVGSGDAVTQTFSALGDQLASTNSLGHATTFSNHNGMGLPGRLVGPNGDTTDYTYDVRGRVTRVRAYPGGVPADTVYTYDADGRVATITRPDGQIQTNFYGHANRDWLTGIEEPSAPNVSGQATKQRLTYTRDLAGNITQTLTQLGTFTGSWQYATTAQSFNDYDELSRPRANRGNNGQNVRYSYDPNGNVKTITDSLNQITTLSYDALDRLIESKDPLNAITRFAYNAGDQRTMVTDPRGLNTTYVYDGFGQLWAQSSPDTGTTTFQYDASGKLTYSTRADSVSTAYQYDGLGRLTWYGTGSTAGRSYGYDTCVNGKSRLCSAHTNLGGSHITQFSYTAEGQVAGQQDWTPTTNLLSNYYYDSSGRLNAVVYPNGMAVGYGYSYGKLTAMTTNIGGAITNVVTGASYRPFGQPTGWTYGNGLTRNRYFDQNYAAGDQRLTGLTVMDGGSTLQSQLMAYNAKNEISSTTDYINFSWSRSYTYDALSRLTEATWSGYAYDANGNRTVKATYATGVMIPPDFNTIESTSNRLSSTRTTQYTYDANGNRIQAHRPGWYATTYQYDVFNQLSGISKWAGSSFVPAASYAYNALDQRAAKVTGGVTTRYVYAGQNQMLAEHSDSTGAWTNYLYFNGELLGMVRANQTYYIHNDHLGRPEIATNNAKAVVWRASNDSFDRSVQLDNIGGLQLGFPGQYYDEESGLWHNGYRDYDAEVGRYIQSDPIGLAGGLNTYAYVGGNPLSFVDPLGLDDVAAILYGSGVIDKMPDRRSNPRLPDYVRISGSYYVFNGSLYLARNGTIYGSAGWRRPSASVSAGASVSGGYLNQCEKPSSDKLDRYLGGAGIGTARAYRYVGGAINWSPGEGTSTEVGVGMELRVPGSRADISGDVTYPLIDTGLSW